MKRFIGTALVVLLVLGLILGSTGCGEEAAPTPTSTPAPTVAPTATPAPTPIPVEKIKMGGSLPLTGLGAYLGESCQKSIDFVIEEFNEAGGIVIDEVQYLIDMTWYDDAYNPQTGMMNVDKLIYEDEVDYLIGLFGSTLAAASTTISENEVLVTTTATGGEEVINPNTPYIFRPYYGPTETGYSAMQWVVDNYGIEKFAILQLETPSGVVINGYYEEVCEELGVETYIEYFAYGVTDYYPMLTSLLANDPDLFFLGPPMLAQAQELGYTGTSCCLLTTANVQHTVGAAGVEGSEGYLMSNNFSWAANAETTSFYDRYVAKYGSYDEQALSWMGLIEAVIQGIEKASSVDPTDVMNALDAMAEAGEPIDLPIGDCYWAGEERYGGLAHQMVGPIHMMDIHNGEARLLDTLPPPTEEDLRPL